MQRDFYLVNYCRGIKIKVVLFDMDGVLYDSMPHHVRAWKETMDACNVPSTERDFYLLEGRTGGTTIDYLFQRHFGHNATDKEKKEIYKKKAARFNELNNGQIMPGAKSVLQKVKESGLRASVVTGSGQPALLAKMERDFEEFIDPSKTVSAFDVKFGKPHPEPYLMALKAWNISPCEAIVIENAPLGIESAKAAGIFTVAVNTGRLEDEILLAAGAGRIYPSMQALADDWGSLL